MAFIDASGVLRHGLLVISASVLVGVLNYGFQLVAALTLRPSEYGTLFSLLGLLSIFAAGSKAFLVVVSRFTATIAATGNLAQIAFFWRLMMRRAGAIIVLLVITIALVSVPLAQFLNIAHSSWILATGIAAGVIVFMSVNEGVLQALQRFRALSIATVTAPLIKLLLGASVLVLGHGIIGALTALIVGVLFALIVGTGLLRDLARGPTEPVTLQAFASYSWLAVITGISWILLVNLDILLVKHYMSGSAAGDYSAIVVLGRIAMYVPAGLALVMFPKIATLRDVGEPLTHILFIAMGWSLLFGLGTVGAFFLFTEAITDTLLQGRYSIDSFSMIKYAFAMALLGLISMLSQFFLALKQIRGTVCIIGITLFELGLIERYHDTIDQVMIAVLLPVVVGLTIMCSLAVFSVRQHDNLRRLMEMEPQRE